MAERINTIRINVSSNAVMIQQQIKSQTHFARTAFDDRQLPRIGRIKIIVAMMLRGGNDITAPCKIFRQPELIEAVPFRAVRKQHQRIGSAIGEIRIAGRG